MNGSLRAIDFKAGQLPVGPPGPKGDKGDKGDKGAKGDPGATCPVGKKLLGGAARAGGTNGRGIFIGTSTVIEREYDVTANNTTATPQLVSVEAIWAKVGT